MANPESGRFVAEIPGVGDVYADLTYNSSGPGFQNLDYCIRQFVEREVRGRVKSESLEPETLQVPVHQEVIQEGKPLRKFVGHYSAAPYPRRLNTSEYSQQLRTCLSNIHNAFHPFVTSGLEEIDSYEERLNHCKDVIADLRAALVDYGPPKEK